MFSDHVGAIDFSFFLSFLAVQVRTFVVYMGSMDIVIEFEV